jgi:D-amino peptidase
MKIYISADIEGITGVTHWDETELDKADSYAAREQMTAEVVAACEGAIQAGATEIWVKDSHDSARNIIPSKLPQEVRLIRGWSGHPFKTLQELDDTFRAVVLIGYHSGAGAGQSPLEHTFTGNVMCIKLNDHYVSEFLIDAYTAAYAGVPLVFVSGDKGLCDQVTLLNPHIRTVAVKEGIGGSTVNIHPELATARIREGVAQALGGDMAQCQVPLPARFSVEVRYRDHARAYQYSFFPGAKQKDVFAVQFDTESYFEVLRFLLFAV